MLGYHSAGLCRTTPAEAPLPFVTVPTDKDHVRIQIERSEETHVVISLAVLSVRLFRTQRRCIPDPVS